MRTPEERFWSKVFRAGPDDCWLWTGKPDAQGYGVFRPSSEGKLIKAHRYSYALANPKVELTPAICIMHSCDNRMCVNSKHLSAGSNADNVADRVVRDRSRKAGGKGHGRAKLDWGKVRNIRANYTGKRGELKYLCALHAITKATMLKMLKGDTWQEKTGFPDTQTDA